MANPNLNSATSVVLNNAFVRLSSTSETQVISNAASSGKAFIIDSIRVTNLDTSNAVGVTIAKYAAATNTGTACEICSQLAIPANGSVLVVAKDDGELLLEAQSIYATAGTANKLKISANWKEFS